MTRMTLIQEAKVTQLNDSDGTDTWELKDSDGFPIFRVDSKGNVKIRGKVTRI